MTEHRDRMDRFDAEVTEMRLKTGRTNREGLLLKASVGLMVAGIALAFGAYLAALEVQATPGSNIDVLDAVSYTPLAVTGLAMSVVGGFVYLRCSLARFLRFWLLRQAYEQQVAIDEVAGRAAEPGPQAPGRSAGTP